MACFARLFGLAGVVHLHCLRGVVPRTNGERTSGACRSACDFHCCRHRRVPAALFVAVRPVVHSLLAQSAPDFDGTGCSGDVHRLFLHRGKLARQTGLGKLQTRTASQRRRARLERLHSCAGAGRAEHFQSAKNAGMVCAERQQRVIETPESVFPRLLRAPEYERQPRDRS